jgi:dUTP pyrophosphatase
MSLRVKKLVENARIPSRGTPGAAGYDLASVVDAVIPPCGRAVVSTGLSIRVPKGTYGRIAPRSGLAVKYGIDVLAGVVDEDYTGDIRIVMFNTGKETYQVHVGDRVAQLVLEKIATPDVAVVVDFDDTERGSGGFGSTGV